MRHTTRVANLLFGCYRPDLLMILTCVVFVSLALLSVALGREMLFSRQVWKSGIPGRVAVIRHGLSSEADHSFQ
ncbi:hypothetical protein BO86DRAFT_72808 [Aspergillus japonicus CBS 114.51]|uniref:Uncharacterized protein n=1 Tax=Aspergillus japonicus CBS 114.51 TaxID=1448312 RepID=A0A8T8XF26_ASPJA|nr:hypothetical protein BO86DRAFT_72808 [Aspergillus japonicus CBS 114.51]RAH86755.1 hypothetical protein BO86DRAFT_72808 [Aspergillus japonicus CBS 114.51]